MSETFDIKMDDGKSYRLNVIYEDNHILVVDKIVNVLSQADNTKDTDMISICKKYIKEKYSKPGNVFLGLVHRLDRPVGGVMVFARTSKAASRLSEQVRKRDIKKSYYAVVEGRCRQEEILEDYLYKDKKRNMVSVVSKNHREAKEARLKYRLVSYSGKNDISLVDIDLYTGRPHQIRVQFSSRGHALVGDQRYAENSRKGQQIALWSHRLSFIHPTTREELVFISDPPAKYPWSEFGF